MTDPVKSRTYDAAGRRRQAAERRRTIVRAAGDLFAELGYARTAMAEVAARAGVSVDTVYESVGRKPQLLLAVHDLILGEGATDETGSPVPALQREYVTRIRALPDARDKIAAYAEALERILPRTAPLLEALREAGATDERCRQVWQEVEDRRAANMRLLVADLRATGRLRDDLDAEHAADLVWSMNSATYFTMLARRGWTPEQYARLVRDVWTRMLLA